MSRTNNVHVAFRTDGVPAAVVVVECWESLRADWALLIHGSGSRRTASEAARAGRGVLTQNARRLRAITFNLIYEGEHYFVGAPRAAKAVC
jgi:hypothetical protein